MTPPPAVGRADLHSHTLYSDGTFTPEELVERAVAAGLAALAVTDHDCVDGIPGAAAAAGGRLEIIPGVEMTVAFRGVELHVLGLFLDPDSPTVQEQMTALHALRRERLGRMIARLQDYGVTVSLEEVLALSGAGAAGRPHLARVLVRQGAVKTPEEAFQRFIGDQAPCFVKGATMTPCSAAAFIRAAGGVAILAHPARFVQEAWLPELMAAGLQGIEAHHPDHDRPTALRYEQYAEQHGLLISGGSDAHGTWKANGPAVGSVTVPSPVVERLRAAARHP